MTFDPRTAYADDYLYYDLVETADWAPENQGLDELDPNYREAIEGIKVCQLADVNNPDYISVTLGLALSPTSKVFVCWSPDDSDVANPSDKLFQPRVNDVIVCDETESAWPGRWLVNNVITSPYSRWVLSVDKARENED